MSRSTISHRAARSLVAVAAAVVALLVATTPPAGAAVAADAAPPRLTGVSLTPSDLTAGGILRLTYTFVAESPVVSAQATLRNRYVSSEYIHLSEVGQPVTGTMTYTVPAAAYTGDYLLTAVTLMDAAGRSWTTNYWYGQHLTHISGTSNDGEPPELTALSLVRAARYADESTTVTYTVSDMSLPLRRLTLYYATGPYVDVPKAKASGTLVLGGPGVPGAHQFHSIEVVDGKGNWATYFRDGTVYRAAAGHQPLDESHSLPLSALDFTAAPGPPGGDTRALPRGARVEMNVSPGEAAAITGFRVTVNPGGKVYSKPVGPIRDGTSWQQLKIDGLANGTAYTIRVVATSRWGNGKPCTTTVVPLPSTNIFSPGDTTGDGRADVVALLRKGTGASGGYTRPVYTYPGNGRGGLRPRAASNGRAGFLRIAPAGSVERGGTLATYFGVDGADSLVRVNNAWYTDSGTGWLSMRFIDGGSDFSGDGRADIVAVAPSGALYRYTMNSRGRIVEKKQIGSGWASFIAVFSPGDFNGDRKADLLAVDKAGRMWLYRGNGRGGWIGPRLQVGSGWAGFGAIVPMRDFNGDGRVDVGAITMSGDFYLYRGNGRGGWLPGRLKIGTGWNAFF